MRWTIDIKLTERGPWQSLGLYTMRPENCWQYVVDLRRAGLYADYFAVMVYLTHDTP